MVLRSYWGNKISLVELFNESTSDGSTNLELLTEDGSGDAKDIWNTFAHSFELDFLEEDGVVKLFLDLNFSPTLFLGLFTFSCCLLFR